MVFNESRKKGRYMKTKDLEEKLGLSKHTIRYYEKEGFIQPKRDENGYRIYDDQDLQILRIVKFLRNLYISIDDVKGILDGQVNFEECLRINHVHMDEQIESLKEISETIDFYKDKNLPLIPALAEIDVKPIKSKLGIQKTTKTVSLGRKLTKPWAIRQILYCLLGSGFMGWALTIGFLGDYPTYVKVISFLLITIFVTLVFLASAFRQTTPAMIDNSMDQSIEFIKDGIRYYRFIGFIHNLKYFFAVLLNRDEKYMKYYRYEDIKKVEIHAKKRYMSIASPIAYEVYVSDFAFEFNDGTRFYFLWPMILDDDARFIAHILENKVNHIVDDDHLLYAMKNGINLNDYMMKKTEE